MAKFDPQFMVIQGDGIFGLFHGERAHERALCAGITLKYSSVRSLAPMIDELFAEGFPDTGFKVGMSAGVLVAKKVGVRKEADEPVRAGKPVNYAVKCAGKADRHELIATANVYDSSSATITSLTPAGCPDGRPVPLWVDINVEKLGKHSQCKPLPVGWCKHHGDEFCTAILDGKRKRHDVFPGSWPRDGDQHRRRPRRRSCATTARRGTRRTQPRRQQGVDAVRALRYRFRCCARRHHRRRLELRAASPLGPRSCGGSAPARLSLRWSPSAPPCGPDSRAITR